MFDGQWRERRLGIPTGRTTVARLADPFLRAGVLLVLGAAVAGEVFDIALEIGGRPYPSQSEHVLRAWCLAVPRYAPFASILATCLQFLALLFALSPRPKRGTTKLAWIPGVAVFCGADLMCNVLTPRACSMWSRDAAGICADLALTGLFLSIGAGPPQGAEPA